MSRSIMIALSNPVSAEQEAEFNHWYDNIHVPEILAAPSVHKATRYKVAAQTLPMGKTPQFRYLAIYEVEDAERAVQEISDRMATFRMTDAFDLNTAIGFAFTQISVAKSE